MATLKAKWINKDVQSLENSGGDLRVKLKVAGDLERSIDGLRVVPGSFIRPEGTIVFSADQSMGGFRLKDLAAPIADTDATTKAYVDAAISGFSTKITEIEVHTISTTDLANKYLVLNYECSSLNDAGLDIQFAPPQQRNVDFEILSSDRSKLSWDGLVLDGVLEEGEIVTVTYNHEASVSTGLPISGELIYHDPFFANDLVPDTTKTGREPYTLYDVYDSIKFYKNSDGGVWFFVNICSDYEYGIDVEFELTLATLANDVNASNRVTLKADVYVTANDEIETSGTPDFVYSDAIDPGTNKINQLQKIDTIDIKIPASVVTAADPVIAVRLWRDTSPANNYDADICLVSIVPSQDRT